MPITTATTLTALTLAALLTGCAGDNIQRQWGIYQEPIAPKDLPAAAGNAELRVLWQRNLGAGAANGYAILKPAFAAAGSVLYAANRSGSVFKLDAASGDIIWQRDLAADIFSAVGVSDQDDLAVVALDNGSVVALAAADGAIRWQTPLGRQPSAIPAVGTGRVIARTVGGRVIGLSADGGETEWSFERAVPGLSIHGDSTPVISGDAVFVGLASGKLTANNVVTGREYWETEVSFARGRNELERLTDSDTSPLVAAATIYTATYQGNVAALRLASSEVKWKTQVSSRLPMTLAQGLLVVTAELGDIVAIDTVAGEIQWTQKIFRGHGMSRPLIIGNRVVVGDATGQIHTLHTATGSLLETRPTTTGAIVSLVPHQNTFAAFSSAGDLSVLALNETE